MRFVRGLLALTLLFGVVAGVPGLLLRAGRLGELARLWTDFPAVLVTPDNGALLLGVLTLLGWVAWAVMAVSVFGELIGLLSGHRIRLPGLARPQAFASVLLVSVAAMVTAPVSAGLPATEARIVSSAEHHATDRPAPDRPVPDRPVRDHPAPDRPTAGADRPTAGAEGPTAGGMPAAAAGTDSREQWLRHPVQRGESLWSIAEDHYGDGRQWSRIAAANPGVDDPDRVPVGRLLILPGIASAPAAEPPAAEPPPQPAAEPPAPAGAGPASDRAPTSAEEAEPVPGSPAQRIALAVSGISSLTAAALLGQLALRRQVQLARRPLGRQLLPPSAPQLHLVSALGQAQDPLTLTTLDLALRALGRHYRQAGEPLPALGAILVGDERISIGVDRVPQRLPVGFHADATRLWLDAEAGTELAAAGLAEEPCPYPSVVCLGELADGTLLLHDLETIGLLGLDGPEDLVAGVLGSLLLELGCSWWGSGQSITVIGGDATLTAALSEAGVRAMPSAGPVLAELEAERTRRPHPDSHPRDLRNQPELAEAWRPRVLLICGPLGAGELERVTALSDAQAVVAVVADPRIVGAVIRPAPQLSVLPNGIEFHAQQLGEQTRANLVELLAHTDSTVTRPAPWCSPAHGYAESPESAHPYSNVTSLGPRRADPRSEEPAAMDAHEPTLHPSMVPRAEAGHPMVLLMGPVELVAARGEPPNRARRQCIEYCAWLLDNPRATASMMANALFVAEGTRRSNMSRLRGWLGTDAADQPYLPDAYSGRITLHTAVSSDWHRMQLLTLGGIDRCAESNLVQSLELVRGAPLADAAPGQWHWAEELRTDISSMVRDIGVVLAARALERGALDLARWAASRALTAAPEDERLLCMRVRTEHRANNPGEVERLALRMVRHARKLNIDLDEETVELLQQVMEGGPRDRGLLA